MALSLWVDGLVVRSQRGRAILEIDRFTSEPGIRLGIRGPSGAGKSTFLHVLAGLLPRVEGSVRWGEHALTGRGAAGGDAARTGFRRAHIGMVFQDFLLFEELGAAANASIAASYAPAGERAAIRDRAEELLARLGIEPGQARTVRSFSGGERQRVAIARALAHDPAIILADEPTASLDRAAADRLIADLADLARATGKTLIAVSHDAALHRRMDRVIDIADGRLQRDEPVHA
ncbi:ABC transporter ATP-binding protein [Nitratireductor soli]|uniref:ABC transporter ATP-binding protein n=1 Tax=Nitratireductor soli TaxID=1670619 RepID=UPI00065E4684|nr:ATP-binding cassette domain-containing protein [Nitratireductor soli]